MKKLLFALSILITSCHKPEVNTEAPILTVQRISVSSLLITMQGSEITLKLHENDLVYWFMHDGHEYDIQVSADFTYVLFLGQKILITQ